ncbi:MAG: 2Fe-2S iron-sulfur cluster-binding protein, partial [Chloroflexota bacterium]|nr:2Fe-2S iron-sulfur cluster-binding protein [Chloroflexota bacterium]
MSQPFRLDHGGRVDRDTPLQFTFDGRPIDAFRGDTVASALLANGVTLVGRSFKYHRPRGIVSAGAEDPNAFVQLGHGARTLPNRLGTVTAATLGLKVRHVNAWPNLEYDLMSAFGLVAPFIPAGFYYKTLMWPRRFWPLYEHVLRHAAGLGHAPTAADPDRYDHVHAHCDVLVVGAGPAGLAAAHAAVQSGARVLLVDEQSEAGGSLLSTDERVDGLPAPQWAATATAELAATPGVTVLPNTTAFGLYESNLVLLAERLRTDQPDDAGSESGARVWRVLPRQIVLATGAHERPLLFANNDRPGVMLAGAISTYVRRYAVAPGSRAVLFTNNDSAYRTALDLTDAGVPVAAIADVRTDTDGDLPSEARAQGIPIHAGAAVRRAHGRGRVAAAELCSLDGAPLGTVECDLLGVSGGFAPALHLHAQASGPTEWDPTLAAFAPRPGSGIHPAGAVAGELDLAATLRQGTQAGSAAAAAVGCSNGSEPEVPRATESTQAPIQPYWLPPGDLAGAKPQFVDLHEDVTLDDLRLSLREGYESIEHVKRYTTLGMGPDQGKLANPLATGVIAQLLGRDPASVGTPRHRPAYSPVSLGAIAGRHIGPLADPVRVTPMQDW